ncbi:MAG TPA: hypothetical protein VF658_17750 [Pyrinomonadaceae bacterium]
MDAPNGAAAAAAATDEPQQTATDSGANVESIAPAATTTAAAPAMAETPVKAEAMIKAETPAPGDVRGKDAVAQSLPVENQPPANVVAPDNAAASSVVPADDAASKRQRVAAVARERVDESLRPRAEKLRRASNVVLDEAAADPSLRFVLVATALIILSLLLLLLGRIL